MDELMETMDELIAVINQNQEEHDAYYFGQVKLTFISLFCFAFQPADLTGGLWAPDQGLLLPPPPRMGPTGPGFGAQGRVCHCVVGTQTQRGLCPRG